MSTDGDRVRQRRERLGMDKKELAEAAGVSRDTVAAIEDGSGFRRSSLTKIERVLDAAEAEAGIDSPAVTNGDGGELIEIHVDTDGSFFVRGPVRDLGELTRSVAELMRKMRDEDDPGPQ